MTGFEETIKSLLVKTVPLPTSAGLDWDGVLARSAASSRSAHTRRLVYSVAFAAAVAIILAATPLGAAIARGFGSFSGWLSGSAGTPVSNRERQAFMSGSGRSWDLFPKGAKLRRLIAVTRDGVDYKLYGYRAGGMFCLRLSFSHQLFGQTSCAPRSELTSRREPVLPLFVDAPIVAKTDRRFVLAEKASVSFGIVSDGVTVVRARTRSGDLSGVVAADSFLIVNPRSEDRVLSILDSASSDQDRVRSISASDAAGNEVAIPFAGPDFQSNTGALMEPLSGPDFRMAKQQITGVRIGWLTRREPRGEAVPTGTFGPGEHTVFARLLTPDPGGVVRVEVSLQQNGDICFGVLLARSQAASGDCQTQKVLSSGSAPGAGAFRWGMSTNALGGDQYIVNVGLVDDRVRWMMLLLVDGQRFPVALKDNAYVYEVPRTEFPARLIAYDSANRVVGTVTESAW